MRPSRPGVLLALDTGSPSVSVAVGPPGEPLAARSIEIRRSSEHLLALVDECLSEAGAAMAGLAGVVVLRGPGSFTGLRVGLATVLGFHQALGLPAAAVPTLEVLAFHGARALGPAGGRVAAAVDALRGEWFVQPFDAVAGKAPEAVAEAAVLGPAALADLAPAAVAGFGVGRLADDPSWAAGTGPRLVEATALATDALRLAAVRPPVWDPAGLVHPLYLRPPAVSLPARALGPPER